MSRTVPSLGGTEGFDRPVIPLKNVGFATIGLLLLIASGLLTPLIMPAMYLVAFQLVLATCMLRGSVC